MYHQNSCLFYNRIAYDRDYSGLSTDDEEGMRTAKQLGDKSVLFMCNHGILLVAPNAARAFDDVYYLERACMTQVRHLWNFAQGGLVLEIDYGIIVETVRGYAKINELRNSCGLNSPLWISGNICNFSIIET